MAKKKETVEKYELRNFKDKSSNWWLNGKHYHLNEQNEIILCAGGLWDEEEVEYLKSYIKRNKKIYCPREKVADSN